MIDNSLRRMYNNDGTYPVMTVQCIGETRQIWVAIRWTPTSSYRGSKVHTNTCPSVL